MPARFDGPHSLDALSLLRARLQALKRDTEEFVKAQDVFQLYKETLQQGEWILSPRLGRSFAMHARYRSADEPLQSNNL